MIVGFDTTVFPKLDYKKPDEFWSRIKELEEFFKSERDSLSELFQYAQTLQEAFNRLDGLIESYTSKICPYCGTVCCANKFGFPEYADIIVFLTLGLNIPKYNLEVDEEAICQFIGEKGCVLSRPNRPYRCTWYFCDPLLVQLELGPAKKYRKFISDLQNLSRARGDIMRIFYPIWEKSFKGQES